MTRPRLRSVRPLGERRLALTFINGSERTVDLQGDIATLPGLAPLGDAALFATVEVADAGWTIEWPAADIQIGADTLWLQAQQQTATDPATRAFVAWRLRNGLSLAAAARALGFTPRTVSAWGTGARPVPRHVLLACRGWEVEQAGRQRAA
jgi:hypothetical protein